MDSPVVQAVLLGVIQGLTEFLPVSSDGHLALAQQLIPGFRQPGVLLDVLLHVGTLAAVVIYFRREVWSLLRSAVSVLRRSGAGEEEDLKILMGIIIASVPTALVGLMLEKRVEALMNSMTGVGAGLVATAGFLFSGELVSRRVGDRSGYPGWGASLLIGLAQGLAVLPGLSRSGSTISVARMFGISGEKAARFSFLLSLPAVTGATLLTVIHQRQAIQSFGALETTAYIVGPLAAGVVGYAAIAGLMQVLRRGRLVWFAPYCAAGGVAAVIFGLV